MSLPKSPKDMNLEELRMLLEVRKLEMKVELQDVQHSLRIGSRILTAVKKTGILDQLAGLLVPKSQSQASPTTSSVKNPNQASNKENLNKEAFSANEKNFSSRTPVNPKANSKSKNPKISEIQKNKKRK